MIALVCIGVCAMLTAIIRDPFANSAWSAWMYLLGASLFIVGVVLA